MKFEKIRGSEIKGHLDIVVHKRKVDYDGEIVKWEEVYIHGDPKGLKSLAKLLIEIAELNQENVEDKYLPIGAREHYHLRPKIELSKSSVEVIVGRLDAKGSGKFYDNYIPNKREINKNLFLIIGRLQSRTIN